MHFEHRIVGNEYTIATCVSCFKKTAMLASWPGLLLARIIAGCRWNAMECSCRKVSYEKVEEYEEYFRECAKSEN